MKNIYMSIVFMVLLISSAAAQQQITVAGNMKLHTGASMSVFGNFANNGTFVDSGLVVNFSGTINQVISGSSVSQFRNGVVNNVSGITLNQSVIISNNLNLLNGPFILNSNTLNIQSGAISAITRTNGFVVSEQANNTSRINWSIGANTGAHIYPFGVLAGEYIPFILNITAGNIGDVSIATYHTVANNTPYPLLPDAVTQVNNSLGADNSANVADRFWQINKNGISGTANITFTAQTSEIGTITNLNAQRWNTITQGWDTPLPGQSNSGNAVTVNNITNFSPWILAGNNVPLPIELLTFTATPNDQRQVDLNWSTTSETNNDYFTIERTTDGLNYEVIAVVDGAGNSNQLLHYYTLDPTPYTGTSYYRLKQTDYNNYNELSNLVSVNFNVQHIFAVNVYPNPTTGNFSISITGAKDENISVHISNMMGKIYYSKMINVNENNFTLNVDGISGLSAGAYNLQVSGTKNIYTTKLIIH